MKTRNQLVAASVIATIGSIPLALFARTTGRRGEAKVGDKDMMTKQSQGKAIRVWLVSVALAGLALGSLPAQALTSLLGLQSRTSLTGLQAEIDAVEAEVGG